MQVLYLVFLKLTKDFEILVDELYKHQAAYVELMKKREECLRLERKVRGGLKVIEEGRLELEEMVREGKEIRDSTERSETSK